MLLVAVLAASAARAAAAEHECTLSAGLDEQVVSSKVDEAARKSFGLAALGHGVTSAQQKMGVSTWCSTGMAKPSQNVNGSLTMQSDSVSDGVLCSDVLCKLAFKTVCCGVPELHGRAPSTNVKARARKTELRLTQPDFGADLFPALLPIVASGLHVNDDRSGGTHNAQAPPPALPPPHPTPHVRGVPEPPAHGPTAIAKPAEKKPKLGLIQPRSHT